MEDVGTLVLARGHGAEGLERVDRAFNLVATSVDRLVEANGSAASAPASLPVGPLASRFGNGALDLASAKVTAVAAGAVRLIPAEMVGAGTRAAGSEPGDAQTFQHRDELRSVTPLARGDQERQGAAAPLADQMKLACQTAPRTSQSFICPVLRGQYPAPRDARGRRTRAGRVLMGPAGGGIDPDHAPVDPVSGVGVRPGASGGSCPRCRQLTSVGDARRRSSTTRTLTVRHARARPSAGGRGFR